MGGKCEENSIAVSREIESERHDDGKNECVEL